MRAVRGIRRWSLRLLAVLVALVLVLAVALVVWSRIGVMDAEPEPLQAVRQDERVRVTQTDAAVVLEPASAPATGTGLLFQPGAKVQGEAYAATLAPLAAEHGITVVITKPWLHLAVFDLRGMDTFTALAPEVETWAVGGHSLGGVKACLQARSADALVLLASFCSTDLSGADLLVLSLSGSEDGLSTPEKVQQARSRLPASARMVEIAGASHASFGAYGPQSGDGTATISDEETAERIGSETADLLAGI